MIGLVTIKIGAAFPRQDGLQRRRLQVGGAPLAVGVIRHAQRADVARAPRQLGCPLDGVIEIHRFLIGIGIRLAGRLAGTTGINADQRVAARTPPHRIRSFPVHVGIRFLLQVCRWPPQFVLLVRPYIHQHRYFLGAVRAQHVAVYDRAVAQLDGNILLDNQFPVLRLRHLCRLFGHAALHPFEYCCLFLQRLMMPRSAIIFSSSTCSASRNLRVSAAPLKSRPQAFFSNSSFQSGSSTMRENTRSQ